MSGPIRAPETLNIYILMKQMGMYFMPISSGGGSTMGIGVFATRNEAEIARTLEYLTIKNNSSDGILHVFELTVPNPAYEG